MPKKKHKIKQAAPKAEFRIAERFLSEQDKQRLEGLNLFLRRCRIHIMSPEEIVKYGGYTA